MTHHRVRLRAHLTITTLDARPCASTHPCVVDLVGTDMHRSRTVSDRALSWPQPVIEPTAGPPQPPLATRGAPLLILQSP